MAVRQAQLDSSAYWAEPVGEPARKVRKANEFAKAKAYAEKQEKASRNKPLDL